MLYRHLAFDFRIAKTHCKEILWNIYKTYIFERKSYGKIFSYAGKRSWRTAKILGKDTVIEQLMLVLDLI